MKKGTVQGSGGAWRLTPYLEHLGHITYLASPSAQFLLAQEILAKLGRKGFCWKEIGQYPD